MYEPLNPPILFYSNHSFLLQIVPATLKKQATAAPAGPAGRRPDMRQGGRGGERGGDRGDYRQVFYLC